jgi:hypothetical protein
VKTAEDWPGSSVHARRRIALIPSPQVSPMFLLDTNTLIYFFKGQGTLVTRHAREFSRLPNLAIMDWYD